MFTSHPFCFRINWQTIEMLFLTVLSLCVCTLNAMAFPYWTHIFHGRTFFCSIVWLFASIYDFCATHSLILLFSVCFFFFLFACACLSFHTLTLFLFFQFVCTHIKIHSLVHTHTHIRVHTGAEQEWKGAGNFLISRKHICIREKNRNIHHELIIWQFSQIAMALWWINTEMHFCVSSVLVAGIWCGSWLRYLDCMICRRSSENVTKFYHFSDLSNGNLCHYCVYMYVCMRACEWVFSHISFSPTALRFLSNSLSRCSCPFFLTFPQFPVLLRFGIFGCFWFCLIFRCFGKKFVYINLSMLTFAI